MESKRLSRRSFLRLSAAAAGAVALAACAPTAPVEPPAEEPKEEEPEEAPPSEEKVSVRWMTRVADWGGQEAQAAVPELMETVFAADHPNIEVVVEPAPPQFEDVLVTSMVAGDSVDIFEAWPAIFNNFVERDLVLDLDPFVETGLTQEEIDDYIPAQWEALYMRGLRAGMPLYVDLRLETYNKDLFDEYGVDYPPEDGDWTVEDYAATAAALTKDTTGDGEIDLWGTIIETAGWFYWPRMFGGSIRDPDDDTKCNLDSEESQAALNFIYEQQWLKEPNVFAQPAQVENAWYYEAFVPQMVAMAQKGCYPARTVDEVGGAFRWDYAHPPKGPAGHKTLVDADGWSIWNGSQEQDAAWEVIKFLSGTYFQENVVAAIVGAIPTRLSVVTKFIDILRESYEELQDVHLEVLAEILKEPGYGGNVWFFKKDNAAMEIIGPANDLVFATGEADPSYYFEICEQVNASQLEE